MTEYDLKQMEYHDLSSLKNSMSEVLKTIALNTNPHTNNPFLKSNQKLFVLVDKELKRRDAITAYEKLVVTAEQRNVGNYK